MGLAGATDQHDVALLGDTISAKRSLLKPSVIK
jgi:hypothetical protein